MGRHALAALSCHMSRVPTTTWGSSARGGGTEASRHSEPTSPPPVAATCCGTPRVTSLSTVGAAGHKVTPGQASLMRLLR
jgi:hypothetical protein